MIELHIDGYYNMIINHINGDSVSDEVQKEILDKLQTVEYIIELQNRKIYALEELNIPVYEFYLNITDDHEYNFNTRE